jgi:uncharacterized phage protein (TIGR02218 family)
MRTISTALKEHLAGNVVTIASCIKITRTDGAIYGLTSYPDSIVYNGITYEPNGSISASSVRSQSGSGVDNVEITGLIDGSMIVASDIRAGKWDAAWFELFLVNYADLTMGKLTLLTGKFGAITIEENSFKVELLGLGKILTQQIGAVTSQTCRCRTLGDSVQCKLSMTGRQHTVAVSSVTDLYDITFNDTQASGYYTYGRCLMQTGLNAGLIREIITGQGAGLVTLADAFPFAVSVGDTAILEQGCDRTYGVCSSLGNQINFHGEPFIPGNDQALQVGRQVSSSSGGK